MRREKSVKVKAIIKCRLLMLNGKRTTAKALAEWINANDFGLSGGVNSNEVTAVIRNSAHGKWDYLGNVLKTYRKSPKAINEYYIEREDIR